MTTVPSGAVSITLAFRGDVSNCGRLSLMSVSLIVTFADDTFLDSTSSAITCTQTGQLVNELTEITLRFFPKTFSALTLLVGQQEGHPACKNQVVGCWRGYLSEERCRLAYGPADATATHCLLLQ